MSISILPIIIYKYRTYASGNDALSPSTSEVMHVVLIPASHHASQATIEDDISASHTYNTCMYSIIHRHKTSWRCGGAAVAKDRADPTTPLQEKEA